MNSGRLVLRRQWPLDVRHTAYLLAACIAALLGVIVASRGSGGREGRDLPADDERQGKHPLAAQLRHLQPPTTHRTRLKPTRGLEPRTPSLP
jgi:hypothetical protein